MAKLTSCLLISTHTLMSIGTDTRRLFTPCLAISSQLKWSDTRASSFGVFGHFVTLASGQGKDATPRKGEEFQNLIKRIFPRSGDWGRFRVLSQGWVRDAGCGSMVVCGCRELVDFGDHGCQCLTLLPACLPLPVCLPLFPLSLCVSLLCVSFCLRSSTSASASVFVSNTGTPDEINVVPSSLPHEPFPWNHGGTSRRPDNATSPRNPTTTTNEVKQQ